MELTKLEHRILAAFGVVAIAAGGVMVGVTGLQAAGVAPPPNALEILWSDYCDREPEVPECSTTASPSPTSSPATPSPTAAATPAPAPSATASPSPTPTASPSATLRPSATTTLPPTPTTDSVTLESQAWWAKDGIRVPEVVGHHIHVQATIPRPGRIVNGRVDVPVRLILHDQVGEPNFVRWQDASSTKGSIPVDRDDFTCTTHDGFTDCVFATVLPIDFGAFGTGLRELRISLNVPDEQPDNLVGSDQGDQRMYQSTGWQVCVRSCSPEYRSGPEFVEARGWYEGHGYQNARLTTGFESVRAGATVGVKLAPGAGGEPTVFSAVYLDPDMHRHNPGRILLEHSGPYSGSVTIPADLAPGTHRLTLLASDGKNAGVLVIPFVVP